MTYSQLVETIRHEKISISHDGSGLMFMALGPISSSTVEALKQHKSELILSLKCLSSLTRGDSVITDEGFKIIWEVYPLKNQIVLTHNKSTFDFFELNSIANKKQFDALKQRFDFIESNVNQSPANFRNQIFKFFESEWRYLFKELNRQMFLLEAWCGPVSFDQRKESKNAMHAM